MSQPPCSDQDLASRATTSDQRVRTFEADHTKPISDQHSQEPRVTYQVDESPFHHQFLLYSSYYHTTMDIETIVIGSNTRNGRPIPQPKPQTIKKKGEGRIDVYSNGVFLKQMPFKVLIRFSKAASVAFPKKEADNKADNGNESKPETGAVKATAAEAKNKPETGEVKGVKKDAQVEKNESLNWADDDGEALELPKVNMVTAPCTASRPGKNQVNFYLSTLYIQPPPAAFEFAFQWMDVAKNVNSGAPIRSYGVTNADNLSLEQLVDLYAVALVLDLRPACHKHRFDLLTRFTEQRPTLATLKYVHEHLPVEDVTVTRFITSYFEHRDLRGHGYSANELKAIEDYVCTIDYALHSRFVDIGESRTQKAKNAKHRREEDKMQRATDQYLHGTNEAGGAEFVDAGEGEQKQGGKGSQGRGKKQQSPSDSGYMSAK